MTEVQRLENGVYVAAKQQFNVPRGWTSISAKHYIPRISELGIDSNTQNTSAYPIEYRISSQMITHVLETKLLVFRLIDHHGLGTVCRWRTRCA